VTDGSSPRTDIALAVLLIVACGVVLFETRDIPPGTFEPLGSAPIPQATAGLIILCALVVLGRALLTTMRGQVTVEPVELELRPRDALVVFLLTMAYVLALQLRLLDFAPLTIAYLLLAIGFLVRFQTRILPWIALVAVVTGYGCQYVFTRVFVVDLPGL